MLPGRGLMGLQMKGGSRDTPLPDYGIDAPDAVRRFLTMGTLAIVVGFAAPSLVAMLPPQYAQTLLGTARSLGWMGYAFVATACVMLWGSRVGKLRLRDKVLATLPWRGDEQVLDVGCGHGLMLIGAAQRLTSGRAVGIDIWRAQDQARNSPQATLRNARLESVAGRIEVRSADARRLPFDAASFDVVLSSWTLHNIAERDGRRRAIEEIMRVLRPGGRVVLIDIRHGAEYAALLRELGCAQVRVGAPSFLFVTPTRVVSAQKPA
ncbi:class I SAM-dependent methyltransferase [Solimonas soli]|uniref:class I SAM-dependent methyltransferase n=1 Tax=Solimonas soli TaxID=413479 RepID=UPI0004B3605A|nr:class I SAM-dependent methyltransferase [Solimonas soli]